MKYIGMDVHSSICSFCVTDEKGAQLDQVNIGTNGKQIINYIRSIEGKKALAFEECELSQWLFGILNKEVDELIVCNPVANQHRNAKTDKLDARRLSDLLRGGFLSGVYHNGSAREQFRTLMSAYEDLIEEAVRVKCRFKSLFRKQGTRLRGGALYHNESFLEGLNRSDVKFIGESQYRILECMENERKVFVKKIQESSKSFKEIRLLKSIPGIGDIQAAKIVAQVVNPERFKNKYKFYAYCGLARHKRTSGGVVYGNTKIYGNRVLKCVYKMAGHSVLRGQSGLRKHYDCLCSKGISARNAYNAVCRKIAAISLSVWRNQRKYDDHKLSDHLK